MDHGAAAAKKNGPVLDRPFGKFGRGCLKGRVLVALQHFVSKCKNVKRACNFGADEECPSLHSEPDHPAYLPRIPREMISIFLPSLWKKAGKEEPELAMP
ncbi:MAG: hypothetical protein KGH96_19830 [Sphingomonadales bacterium]|nr:hypothetical protein [Sphingomonadales bacterium]